MPLPNPPWTDGLSADVDGVRMQYIAAENRWKNIAFLPMSGVPVVPDDASVTPSKVVNGGTYPINVSGNAATATNATNASALGGHVPSAFVRTVNGAGPDGVGNVTVAGGGAPGANSVDNTMLTDMGANTIKGAVAAGDPANLTPLQVATILTGDAAAKAELQGQVGGGANDGVAVGTYWMAVMVATTYDTSALVFPATVSASHATYGLPAFGTWSKRQSAATVALHGSTDPSMRAANTGNGYAYMMVLYQRTA